MSFDGSNLNVTGSAVISNNLTVDGTITARELIISSSVTNMTTQYASGSTSFGDTQDDTHNFTGSIYTTGSMVIKGNLRVEGTTTLVQTTDINADSLIISGAMSILKNQIGSQIKSASLTIQNLGTLGDRSNMSTFTVIDCGDGFF
jgi:cytoskeletal protein CcmA (bactofilin family)